MFELFFGWNIPRIGNLWKCRFTRRLFSVSFWRRFGFWRFWSWIVKEPDLIHFCFENWNRRSCCTSFHLSERCCSSKNCICGLFNFLFKKRKKSLVQLLEMDAVNYRHFPGSQFELTWVMQSSINLTQVVNSVPHLLQSMYLFVLICLFRLELIKFDFRNSTWPTPNGKFEHFHKLNKFWMQFELLIIK